MTLRSSRMRQPSSLCILRPKPEPTDIHTSAASPNSETIIAILGPQENDLSDSKAQCTSNRMSKTEEDAAVSSPDEPSKCAIGARTAPPVSQK
ncbi:unnamed protein product, partial [Dicrocoelium dendriticum]